MLWPMISHYHVPQLVDRKSMLLLNVIMDIFLYFALETAYPNCHSSYHWCCCSWNFTKFNVIARGGLQPYDLQKCFQQRFSIILIYYSTYAFSTPVALASKRLASKKKRAIYSGSNCVYAPAALESAQPIWTKYPWKVFLTSGAPRWPSNAMASRCLRNGLNVCRSILSGASRTAVFGNWFDAAWAKNIYWLGKKVKSSRRVMESKRQQNV